MCIRDRINSINNLRSFPWISDLVTNNKIKLHGWWFDMENSSLWDLKHKDNKFVRLVP